MRRGSSRYQGRSVSTFGFQAARSPLESDGASFLPIPLGLGEAPFSFRHLPCYQDSNLIPEAAFQDDLSERRSNLASPEY